MSEQQMYKKKKGKISPGSAEETVENLKESRRKKRKVCGNMAPRKRWSIMGNGIKGQY